MKKSLEPRLLQCFVLLLMTLSIWSCSKDDSNTNPDLATVSFDGFLYHPVKIGNQIWLKENLRSKKFCNGDPIPYAKDNGWWNGPGTGASGEWLESLEMEKPAYCYYKDSMYYATIYGNLYSGFAVFDERGICPCEYHVPTKEEWQELIDNLGGADFAAAKLKEEGYDHWEVYNFSDPKNIANNSSRFTALGGGIRNPNLWLIEDVGLKQGGYWWSSTLGQEDPNQQTCCIKTSDGGLSLNYDDGYASNYGVFFGEGASVRCLKNK